LQIETVKLTALKPDPNNARRHNDKNLEAIAGSLKQFGQRKPIVINSDNSVLAGNGTLSAALQLGWKEIVAVRVPGDWSREQQMAYALADNRSAELAEWNQEKLDEQVFELQAAEFDLAIFGFDTPEGLDEFPTLPDAQDFQLEQMTFILHKSQADTIRASLAAAKSLGDYGDTGNTNSNGNAIARVAELFLGAHGESLR
jgi:hypothetical protein